MQNKDQVYFNVLAEKKLENKISVPVTTLSINIKCLVINLMKYV